ncbi:AHH domain-containing protein [Bacillus aquiflavi]|uniref:AHH domain-containing protein n=1 Tax=Bacillus aquiflavi TaxID=2672567 RepID=UPI001C554A58|nr:AHH domain-containing protein [Bacillus aquiflavi]
MGVGEVSQGASRGNNVPSVKTKPNQVHHYATNKNKTYTPQMEEIASKYGLDLDYEWNKELLPHQGRHPNAYHEYILDNMKQFDEIAQGNKELFLELYEGIKTEIRNNPEMLYKEYWNNPK